MMDNKQKDLIYGYDAAAEVCGVSSGTIANWVKNGRLAGCFNRVSERKIAFSREKLERRIMGNML